VPCGGKEKAFGAANERIATLIEAQKFIGGMGDTDADGFSNRPSEVAGFTEPERPSSAHVEAVVAAVDLKSGSESSRAAGEVEKPNGLAVLLHEGDAVQRFDGANEDGGGGARRFAHDIEHEVCTVVEENIDVAGSEIHRTNPRSWAAEMVTCRIAGRVGFRLHDTAA